MFNKSRPAAPWHLIVYILLIAVISLAIIGSAVMYFSAPVPDKDTYQALFLTNGQVYFGKLQGTRGNSPVLKDVFYLQFQEPQQLQQASVTEEEAEEGGVTTPLPTPASVPQFNLTKLGQAEIHQPQDTLYLSKDQILFWENLSPDSEVLRTIREYKAQAPR